MENSYNVHQLYLNKKKENTPNKLKKVEQL